MAVNPFEIKDYSRAFSSVEEIRKYADNIKSVFDNINSTMDKLFGEDWKSTGAENSFAEYKELSRNYEIFYSELITVCNDIKTIVNKNIDTDKAAQDILNSAIGS